MKNLSEKTEELLRAVGVNNVDNFKGYSVNEIDFFLFWNLVDDDSFTAFDIDNAADEIAEALK